jgi:hypothetical protein
MITPVRNHPTCAQNATLEACGFRAMEICKKNHTARKTQAGRRIVSRRRKQINAGSRTNVMRAAGLQMKNAPKTPLIAPLAPIRGAEEYGSMESKSILVGLSFGLGPSHVCYPLAQESDHERILAFEFVRVNGKNCETLLVTTCLSWSRATGSKRLSSSGLMKRAAERYPFSAEAGVKLARSTTKLRANWAMTDSGIYSGD